MFKLTHVLDKHSICDDEVTKYLDEHFHPELAPNGGSSFGGRILSRSEDLEYWGQLFREHMPRKRLDRFIYICNHTDAYSYQNLCGRACQQIVWPAFFTAFPKGRILLIELDKIWFHDIWHGQFDYARRVGFKEGKFVGLHPQDMSGLQSENLPFSALQIAQFGTYPLILFGFRHTSGDLTCVYVPPNAFKHSQMTESGAFNHVLWHLHHVFNDQWTFDSHRGPKSITSAKHVKPTKCIDYIRWITDAVSIRMREILQIDDAIRREQLTMTFNRASCDAILAAASQLPYMSKVFFFACLDKVANFLVQIDLFDKDTVAWRYITSEDFLGGEFLKVIRTIPDTPGKELISTIESVSENLRLDGITPDLLRDYRNSHHGYSLTRGSVERLFRHSGEIHNDTTLLATPLLLYLLKLSWS
jgi:hypothetical protein